MKLNSKGFGYISLKNMIVAHSSMLELLFKISAIYYSDNQNLEKKTNF